MTISQQGLRVLARTFPAWAERIALDRFARPRRVQQPVPDVAAGWSAHRFWVPFPGGALRAWTWGQGPAVVLAHGWSGNAAQMTGFIAPLLEAGYRVVAFDQPAHGFSRGRRADLLSFTQALETVSGHVGQVQGVIAHSLGATAAALATHRGLDLRGLVLIAPPVELPGHVF
ncbi:MAG TPA: alpha/beta fold hydrolase, partial [bacterium]|nr:alpha/beta fold hydrolase [bacterium]